MKQIGDYDFQKVARMTHFETDVAASNDLQQRTKPHKDGDGGNGSSNSKKNGNDKSHVLMLKQIS